MAKETKRKNHARQPAPGVVHYMETATRLNEEYLREDAWMNSDLLAAIGQELFNDERIRACCGVCHKLFYAKNLRSSTCNQSDCKKQARIYERENRRHERLKGIGS